jgi:protein-arginine kinase activator protein McsA
MYCDDCGTRVAFDLTEFAKRQETRGAVLCNSCDSSFIRRMMNGEMRAHDVRA